MPVKVTFLPIGKTVEVQKDSTILEAAQEAGIYINSICGGAGVCGKCKVLLKEGYVDSKNTPVLTEEEKEKGYTLACTSKIYSDIVVEIPLISRLEGVKILTGEISTSVIQTQPYEICPLTYKLFLNLTPPSLIDNTSDLSRIESTIQNKKSYKIMQTGLTVIKQLSDLLRKNDWQVTVTLGQRGGTMEIVQVEPKDTSLYNYGIALDIGTTTVVIYLVDLNTCRIINTQATYNSQIQFGDDVISRIQYAELPDGTAKLQKAITDDINNLIVEAVKETKIDINDITSIVCAGNTTMIHLLLALHSSNIRKMPYIPTATFLPVIRAREANIKINPRGLLSCIPAVGSYVGGDITAGVIACGMAEKESISMLIDIGTNGEIVLGNKDWLVCCSASAGPSFEGVGIKCGMRASKGAIEKVNISAQKDKCNVNYKVIGGVKPRGICGSALIDIISELLKTGILSRTGKFNREVVCQHLRQYSEGYEFVFETGENTDTKQDIVIQEGDIASILRSKAAIYASISVLLKEMGVAPDDIETIFIAGGFGNYLNIPKAISIGLLPNIPVEKYKFIGNSSVNGATLGLISNDAYEKAEEIARKMTYFELMVNQEFMHEFVAAMFFPHTNLELFKEYL